MSSKTYRKTNTSPYVGQTFGAFTKYADNAVKELPTSKEPLCNHVRHQAAKARDNAYPVAISVSNILRNHKFKGIGRLKLGKLKLADPVKPYAKNRSWLRGASKLKVL